jgi:F-type H+-transporting ATPase subunit delta
MAAGNVAGVYAAALLELAKANGSTDQVIADCRNAVEALTLDVVSQLDHPSVTKAQAKQALRTVFAGSQSEVISLLQLLVDRNRLADAQLILRTAVTTHERANGLVNVTVVTAIPIDGEDQQRMDRRLRSLPGVGERAAITWSVDAGLVGGITVRVDDLFIDGSVRRRLADLKQLILDAPIASDRLWSE